MDRVHRRLGYEQPLRFTAGFCACVCVYVFTCGRSAQLAAGGGSKDVRQPPPKNQIAWGAAATICGCTPHPSDTPCKTYTPVGHATLFRYSACKQFCVLLTLTYSCFNIVRWRCRRCRLLHEELGCAEAHRIVLGKGVVVLCTHCLSNKNSHSNHPGQPLGCDPPSGP